MSQSAEYIHFIKTFLINSCYIHYCNEINKLTDPVNDVLGSNLLYYKNDKTIWDTVFSTTNTKDLLKYYIQLSDNMEKYDQNRLSNVYQQTSFQEYIDSMVNFQEIGYREYQKFIRSMQDIKFKNNMFNKYQKNSDMKIVKNHIVYIIQLHLSKKLNFIGIFSQQEENDMDIMIDAIPYFNYISENGWSIDQIELGEIHTDENQSINKINVNILETKVLQQINRAFCIN